MTDVISFIIPAHNEEQQIGRAIASIHGAMRHFDESYEIVVADDASTDRTAEIARGQADRVVSVDCRQISRTRNRGAAVSRGRVLIFVDADTYVNRAVVQAALLALERGAVGGGCSVRFDGPIPPWSSVMLPPVLATLRIARVAAGCFVFCRRKAFERVGGFDESMFAAEEVALSWSLGRIGRFVILHQSVRTSARKLRTHSLLKILQTLTGVLLRGPAALRQRAGLGLWYDVRRESRDHREAPGPEPFSDDRRTTGPMRSGR